MYLPSKPTRIVLLAALLCAGALADSVVFFDTHSNTNGPQDTAPDQLEPSIQKFNSGSGGTLEQATIYLTPTGPSFERDLVDLYLYFPLYPGINVLSTEVQEGLQQPGGSNAITYSFSAVLVSRF
jgi:hypothetical protein